MRIKTIIIILITILLTIVLTQNTGRTDFEFLWTTFSVSKLLVLLTVALIAFILGVLVGRPKKIKRLGGEFTEGNLDKGKSNTLSDEDREYIN
jgi:uncharacterized integral membrane protein